MKTERVGPRAASGGGVFEIVHSWPTRRLTNAVNRKKTLFAARIHQIPLSWKLIGAKSYRKHLRTPGPLAHIPTQRGKRGSTVPLKRDK